MNYQEFVTATINSMEKPIFDLLKEMLVGEYIIFSIIFEDDVTREILAEKMCDYFEKCELKTGKNFEKQLENYMKDIDSIVVERIVKNPQVKKKDTAPVIAPRARRYYDKAIKIKGLKNITMDNLIDFTRIMMCLYIAIIENQYKEISDLDFAVKCLKPDVILESMKEEKAKIGKKKLFDVKECYCSDRATFVITIIMLYTIINNKIQGEYNHE